jgi:hypothetical protein
MFVMQIKEVRYISKKCDCTGLLRIKYTFLEIYFEWTNCPVKVILLSVETIIEIALCLKLESCLD